MGLYKRGSTWWISFTFNGKQVRTSAETDDKKLAEKIYFRVMGEVVEGRWFEKPAEEEETFREMMDKYMREHSAVKKRSTSRDEASLKHLLPFFGDYALKDIYPRLVSRYKSERLSSGAAPSTLNRELALMKHAFSLALKEWEWALQNPLKMVSMEKEAPPKELWLTIEEERDLLLVSPDWLREIIVFALDTGCRRGEILSLSWKHVNLSTRVVAIFGEKTGDWRGIPLTQRAYDVLEMKHFNRKVRSLRDDIVFSHPDGRAINIHELRWSLETALKKAAIKNFRFHDTRHTFATRLAQNGVDPLTTQKLLGHKSFTTTQRYAHHYTESLRRGIDSLNGYVAVPGDVEIMCSKVGNKKTGSFITNLSHQGGNAPDFSWENVMQKLAR